MAFGFLEHLMSRTRAHLEKSIELSVEVLCSEPRTPIREGSEESSAVPGVINRDAAAVDPSCAENRLQSQHHARGVFQQRVVTADQFSKSSHGASLVVHRAK